MIMKIFYLLLLSVSFSSFLNVGEKISEKTGILITGGITDHGNPQSAESEVYDVSTGKHCILPPLPSQIYGHT